MADAGRFSPDGQYALVIGGTSGIGRELAKGFLHAGARVIIAGSTQEKLDRALARTPMDRWGERDELAGGATFLASPAAGFVTGETIRVDGGFLAAGL